MRQETKETLSVDQVLQRYVRCCCPALPGAFAIPLRPLASHVFIIFAAGQSPTERRNVPFSFRPSTHAHEHARRRQAASTASTRLQRSVYLGGLLQSSAQRHPAPRTHARASALRGLKHDAPGAVSPAAAHDTAPSTRKSTSYRPHELAVARADHAAPYATSDDPGSAAARPPTKDPGVYWSAPGDRPRPIPDWLSPTASRQQLARDRVGTDPLDLRAQRAGQAGMHGDDTHTDAKCHHAIWRSDARRKLCCCRAKGRYHPRTYAREGSDPLRWARAQRAAKRESDLSYECA